MFCHKCGTEIPSDDASFCINCREPLLKIPSTPKESSENPSNNNTDPLPSSVNLEFGENDEALKMSDPIDFLMNESEDVQDNQYHPNKEYLQFTEGIRNNEDEGNAETNQEDEHTPEKEYFRDTEGIQNNEHSEHTEDAENFENVGNVENAENIENIQNDVPARDEESDQDKENIPEDDDTGNAEYVQDSEEIEDNEESPVEEEIRDSEASETGPEDESSKESPVEHTPETAPTDKISPAEEKKPDPLFTGDSAGSSMDIEYIGGGQQDKAVATLPEKPKKKEMPPVLEVPRPEDPNKGENIIATAKIKVDESKKEPDQNKDFESFASKPDGAKKVSDPTNLDIAKIKRSSGVAYLTGNSVSFAGGARISAGDKIQVGESSYDVRVKPKNKNELYFLIGSVALAIFITFYFLGAFSSSSNGSLVGTVIDSNSRPLPNQEVRVKETGDKFVTNSAGFFIFDNLPEGIYTVQYLDDDEIIGEERITVLSNKTSTLRLARNGSRRISSIEPEPPASKQQTVEVMTVAASGADAAVKKKRPDASES